MWQPKNLRHETLTVTLPEYRYVIGYIRKWPPHLIYEFEVNSWSVKQSFETFLLNLPIYLFFFYYSADEIVLTWSIFSVSWTQLISEWFLGISSAWVKAIWTMLKYHEWPVISKNTRSHTIFSSNSRKNFSVMLPSMPHVDLTTKKSCLLWINAWFRILFTWFFSAYSSILINQVILALNIFFSCDLSSNNFPWFLFLFFVTVPI